MAVISIMEIFDLIFMTFVVGYIFSDFFIKRGDFAAEPKLRLNTILVAAAVTAPAIILHEMAHKFVALFFGLQAVFHASYFWLFIGVILKFLGPGFIFFVPGYVSIGGSGTNLQYALTALAGPLMNALIWLAATGVMKYGLAKHKYWPLILISKKINGFLFVFNMLPIPGFDGFNFYYGIAKILF